MINLSKKRRLSKRTFRFFESRKNATDQEIHIGDSASDFHSLAILNPLATSTEITPAYTPVPRISGIMSGEPVVVVGTEEEVVVVKSNTPTAGRMYCLIKNSYERISLDVVTKTKLCFGSTKINRPHYI